MLMVFSSFPLWKTTLHNLQGHQHFFFNFFIIAVWNKIKYCRWKSSPKTKTKSIYIQRYSMKCNCYWSYIGVKSAEIIPFSFLITIIKVTICTETLVWSTFISVKIRDKHGQVNTYLSHLHGVSKREREMEKNTCMLQLKNQSGNLTDKF